MFFGERLYADFFNFTFPGTQDVYYLCFRTFGLRSWIPNATALVLGLAVATLTFAVGTRVLAARWACIAAIVSACLGYGAAVSPTHHFFCITAVLAAVVWIPVKESMLRWAAVGTALAFAIWFSQLRGLSVALVIAIVILSGMYSAETPRWAIRLRELSCYVGMLVAVLAILLTPSVHHVGISRFLDCTIDFTFKHGRALRDNQFFYNFTWEGLGIRPGLWNLRHVLEPLLILILIPSICALIFTLLIRSSRDYVSRHRLVFVMTAVLWFSFASVLPSPSQSRIAPDASLGFIALFWFLKEHVRSARWIAMTLLVISLCLVGYRLRPTEIMIMGTPAGRIAVNPSEYGSLLWEIQHIKPGSYFLSAGYGDYFPLSARSPIPSAFLTNTPYTPAWQVEKTVENLQEKDVRYIKWNTKELDVQHSASPAGDNLGPLRDYTRKHYRLIFSKDDCEYFERVN